MADTVKLEIIVDDKGSLVIKNFKDVVGKSMGEVSTQSAAAGSSITKLWKDMALGQLVASGIKTAYSSFVGILKDSAGEYLRAEEGNASLRQTLINLGDATIKTFNVLDEYAKHIQATTVVDDDMAKSLMQLGLNMGIPIKQIGGATEAAIGLTKAFKGMSLDQAMKATAAVLEGNTQKLQRYIPELKETATASEKLAIVQKAMADGLKIAHNEITTGAGKLKQFRNDWDDIKEAIGKVLIEAILPMLNGLRNWFNTHKAEIIATVESWGKAFADFAMTIGGAIKSVVGFLVEHKDLVMSIGVAYTTYFAVTKIMAIVEGFRAFAISIAASSIAMGPMLIALAAAAAAFLVLKKIIDETAVITAEYTATQKKFIDEDNRMVNVLSAAASAAGLQNGEMSKLIEAYKGNVNALAISIAKGEQGIKLQETFRVAYNANAEAIKKATAAEKTITEVHTALIPKIKDTAAATEVLKIKNWELDQATKTYKESLPGLNQLLANLKTSEFEIASTFKLSTVATDANTFSLNQNKVAKFNFSGASWAAAAATKDETDKTNEASAATEKWYKDAQDLAAGLQTLNGVFNQLIPGLGDVISGFMGAYEAVAKYAAASNAGTATLGGFLGAAGAVIGGLQALGKAYEAYVQAQQRDFVIGMNEGINVTEEMAEKIRLLAEEMAEAAYDLPDWTKKFGIKRDPSWDEFAAATSKLLNEIINQTDLTADNFDEYAIRVRYILADLDRGMLTEAETAKEMGDAFEALMTQAKELGTEGSASLTAMFEDLANRGIKVKEVMEYIDAQMAVGLAGYKKMKAATLENADALAAFGGMGIKVFDDIIAYEEKIAANRGLVDGIEGATAALTGLSNAQKLTEAQFDQFATAGDIAYQKLLAGGMTSSEALKTMGPYLQRLQFLHEQYGYTIDETTQKMIDQAIVDGVVTENKKTDSQKMIDLLGSIAKVLGADIPGALDETAKAATDAFGSASKAAGQMGDAIDNATRRRIIDIGIGDINMPESGGWNGGQQIPIYAASGWEGIVAGGSNTRFVTGEDEPEYVNITPLSKINNGWASPRTGTDSRQTIIVEDHSVWHIQVDPKSGIDQNALCEGINIVVKNNRQQVADNIAAAVARKL